MYNIVIYVRIMINCDIIVIEHVTKTFFRLKNKFPKTKNKNMLNRRFGTI